MYAGRFLLKSYSYRLGVEAPFGSSFCLVVKNTFDPSAEAPTNAAGLCSSFGNINVTPVAPSVTAADKTSLVGLTEDTFVPVGMPAPSTTIPVITPGKPPVASTAVDSVFVVTFLTSFGSASSQAAHPSPALGSETFTVSRPSPPPTASYR